MRLYGSSKDTVHLSSPPTLALRRLTQPADNVAMAVREFNGPASPLIQYLHNGLTPPDSLTTGPLWVPDNEGTLVSAGADRLAVPGMRLATTVAEGAELGPELVTNGGLDTDTGWTKGTGWVISDGRAVCDGTQVSTSYFRQVISVSAGDRVLITYEAFATTDDTFGVLLGNSGSLPLVSGLGIQSIEFVWDGLSSDLYMRAPAGCRANIDNISVRKVKPKFVPTDTEGTALYPSQQVRTRNGTVTQYTGDYKGMMVMPARTNLLTYSEQFDNAAWINDGVTVTPNAVEAPDGSTTASIISCASATEITQAVSNADAAVATFSIYARQHSGGGGFLRFIVAEDLSPSNYFHGWINLSTGAFGTIAAVGTGTLISYGVEPSILGFNRFFITGTASGTTYTLQLYVTGADNSTSRSATPVVIWGAQLEAGDFPTPYIPTEATTVTRAATVAQWNSANFLRTQGLALWGRFYPGAAGQSAHLLGCKTDADNLLEVTLTATTVKLNKIVAAAAAGPSVSYTHAKDTGMEYRALLTEQGMSLQVKQDEGAWSAWVDDTSDDAKAAAVIASTFQIGADGDGAGQVGGTFPFTASAFTPSFADLAAGKIWVETNTQWNVLGVSA